LAGGLKNGIHKNNRTKIFISIFYFF